MQFLKMFAFRSFRQAVVALIWASVSVPVLILCIYQLRDGYNQRLHADARDLEMQTERASFVVSQSLRQIMDDLDRIASDGGVIRSLSMPMLSPTTVQKFGQFLGDNTAAVSVMLIDKELFPVEVLPSMALNDDLIPYQEFMTEIITSPESIRDPRPRLYIPAPSKNMPLRLIFARPVLTAKNSIKQPFQVAGLLFVSISPEKLIADLRGNTKIDYELVRFYNKNTVYFESNTLHMPNLIEHRKPIQIGRNTDKLTLGISHSSQGIWKQVLINYRMQGFIVLLFIGLMLVIIKLLASKLGQPLRALSQLTSAMSTTDFNTPSASPITINTSDINYREFTEVFQLLRAMESTIHQQFKQLHDANATLEEKVIERTTALEKNLGLLDRQKKSLNRLVKFSFDVQKAERIEESGKMVLDLANSISGQKFGIYIQRSEYFAGFKNYDGLATEHRHFLFENSSELNSYLSLLRLAKHSDTLQFFTIGSSTPNYQGFLITEKNAALEPANEALMVLCTMFVSAIKQHNLNSKLHLLAHVDSVTMLPNRHYFNAKFNEKSNYLSEHSQNEPFGVFVVDVNGLKTINDHYGHHHGDEMLTLIASALKNTARSHDTVARVGGDEFYIILENANLETCERFAERLTSTSNELSMKINGDTLPVNFSFGFASTDMDSLKNLLALADERMYFAKKNHYKALAKQS